MIGRADIEGSKSDVARNAWLPQVSYTCGNSSDTSCLKLLKPKGPRGPPFTVSNRTEIQDQASICPFAQREVPVLAEIALGHLRYRLTDVPSTSIAVLLQVILHMLRRRYSVVTDTKMQTQH
ncbi:uncharacterized protein [Dermacentor albipictus]|uniref:uncharacterized protein n=1 Tax=Dermacentor albipictus TaxID=60249 RepID=UPI0038FC96DE